MVGLRKRELLVDGSVLVVDCQMVSAFDFERE